MIFKVSKNILPDKIRKLLIVKAIFFFLFIAFQTPAQQLSLQGNIKDTTGQGNLKHAVIMAVKLKDSLLISYTRSDEKGFFKMEHLPVDTYQVIISHPAYGDQILFVLGNPKDTILDFKTISMPPKSVNLNEVTIFGYKDPIYYKGDTLVYTADSFKVKQNAVVEDLLKKLPGIKVDASGKIYSQGKAVDQVLVDGDEFFGADPTVATKNLAASSVESVQVYDKKNEASGNDDKETVKVMDLKLKEDARKGYFGKVSGATDFDKFYESEVLLNKFKGSQKISVFGLGSNTPRSNFGWNDMFTYGLDNEMNFQTGDDGTTYYYSSNNQPKGIPRTYKTGFYFTDRITKKTKLSANYSYNNGLMNENSSIASQYFLTDTTYKTNKTQTSRQETSSHAVNFTVTQTIDSLTDLEWQSKLKYNENNSDREENNSFLTNTDTLTRSTDINNHTEGNTTDWTNSIKITRNFQNRDRKLVVNYSLGMIKTKASGFLKSDDTYFYNQSIPAIIINQRKTSESDKQTHYGSITYVEPLSKKIKLEFSYDINLIKGEQDRTTFDFINGNYNSENPALTNSFETSRLINRIGTKFIYEVKKQVFTLGAKGRQVNASNTDRETNEKISQEIRNILPFASYRYKFSDNQNLGFRYNTDSKQPDLNQLQPVPDNTNPNYIVKGNPDLLPTYNHNFNINYNQYNPVSGRNMWCGVNFTYTNHAIANNTSYDNEGRTISQPVNVEGNYNSTSYFNFNLPLFSKILELTPYVDFNFSNSTNYINDQKNTTKQLNGEFYFGGTLHFEKVEFSTGGTYSYYQTSSTLSSQSNQKYFTNNYDASLEWEMPLKFKIKTDAQYSEDKQRSAGYNISYIVWNASLEKRFLKNENLIVSVDANDILNENINTQRTIQDNVISDIKSTIIGRYILFKVTFKFNSNKAKGEGSEE